MGKAEKLFLIEAFQNRYAPSKATAELTNK
jgi:hypothetical protein